MTHDDCPGRVKPTTKNPRPSGEGASGTGLAGGAEPLLDDAPLEAATDRDGTDAVATNSLTAARWIALSRITGFVRAAVIAAVLGPTYLGNTFQATNQIPNYTFEFLTGSLLSSLLVPSLVKHIDRGDREATERVARGFLGYAVAGFTAVAVAGVLLGPLLLRLLSIGVDNAGVAADQRRVGLLLLAMVLPQVVLYGIAGVGQAVQNAHGRFSLAYAAPLLENVGIILMMVAVAVIYGSGTAIGDVGTDQLLLLGLGATLAVALHAGAQCWGAWRVGVTLIPRAGWRDPEVRTVMRRAIPSLGYSGLNALRVFSTTIVANGVAGGVVAFSVAYNFFHLPTAVGARPIAFALLPRLSRLRHAGQRLRMREEFVRGLGTALFATVPAALAYLVLAYPLARATAFGEMAHGDGVTLLAAALAALSIGVLGESVFVVSTNASYAMDDAHSPFRSMLVRSGVSLAGMVIALAFFDDVWLLVALGLSVSIGNVASAWHLLRRLRSQLPAGDARLAPPFLRALAASVVMVVPAFLIAVPAANLVGGQAASVAGMLAGAAVGVATFLWVQRSMRSPELAFFASGLRRFRTRGAAG